MFNVLFNNGGVEPSEEVAVNAALRRILLSMVHHYAPAVFSLFTRYFFSRRCAICAEDWEIRLHDAVSLFDVLDMVLFTARCSHGHKRRYAPRDVQYIAG